MWPGRCGAAPRGQRGRKATGAVLGIGGCWGKFEEAMEGTWILGPSP